MVLRRIITRLLYSPTRHLVLRPPSASGQRVGLSSTRAPHLSPQLPQLRRRPTSHSSSSASSRSDIVRFDSTQRALYSSGVDGGLHESGGGSSRLDLPWGVDPSGGSHPASRARLPLPGVRIPGLRGFIKDPATYKSLAPKSQRWPSVDKEVDVRPSPPPRRPGPPPARRARSSPSVIRPLAPPAAIPSSALRRRPERVPNIATPSDSPVVAEVELERSLASPELATTIPTPRLGPLASLGPTLVALLESPATPLEGLSISPAAFSRVLELVGSQTSTFSARELAEEADKTAHELDTLVRTREQAARLVLKMTENRPADCLSMADEYWVQRAWLQLSLSDLALPSASYSFNKDRVLILQLPFFRSLLSTTSTASDARDAVQHFITLLPRLSLSADQAVFQPRKDVVEVLDLILNRCRDRGDFSSIDLVLTSLLDLRRPKTGTCPPHREHVSLLLRQVFQAFDGSTGLTAGQSIDFYERLRHLGLSADLGSAALVHFGLSMSELWAAAKVLANPTLSSRHFHLLAYRMLLASGKIAADPATPRGRKFFETSRLARVFRRMGSDPGRKNRPLSVDLRDRIVRMLSENGSRSEAAWIYLNHPTIPVSATTDPPATSIVLTIGPDRSYLPPALTGIAPLPLPLAEQLLLILLHGRPTEPDLLLALSVLESLPSHQHHIKHYNLLLRQTFTVLPRRDEADAFASRIHALLATQSHLVPNIQTLEAHLHAWPKTSRHRPWDPQEMDDIDAFRAAAMDAFFSLVERRGAEFRRRTWEVLVGAAARECGPEAGKEAIEWMRVRGGMDPDGEVWGAWLDGVTRCWDGGVKNKGAVAGVRVGELMVEEGMEHNSHAFRTLLQRALTAPSSPALNGREAVRTLFLTQLVARGFPGTGWINFIPSSSPRRPSSSSTSYGFTTPQEIHLVRHPGRDLQLTIANSSPSSTTSPPSSLIHLHPLPSVYDLQPPSHWDQWFFTTASPSLATREFEYAKHGAPIIRDFLAAFRRVEDEEFILVCQQSLKEGREEERLRREKRGRGWWEGGWEWEDEWR